MPPSRFTPRALPRRTSILVLPLLLALTAAVPQARGPANNRPAKPPQSTPSDRPPPPASAYAGDAACVACHQPHASTYAETAHHLTSQAPNAQAILGDFAPGHNIMSTLLPSLTFAMEAKDGRWTQSAVMQVAGGKSVSLTQPIDIVVGAGRKAQTYLYWQDNQLFELPVSYWTDSHQWTNSPGYEDGTMEFGKTIVPRCLECHATRFDALPAALNAFKRDSLVLGISCEKCHGPAAEHVALYRSPSPPAHGMPTGLVDLHTLPRERQIDGCALCHAGAVKPIAPTLSYLPGDDISRFLQIPSPGPTVAVDVHGNQVELLRRSKCFRQSAMTCTTCHNVHAPQRDAASYTQFCLGCHKAEAHPKLASASHDAIQDIRKDCVSCHMPLQKSELLFSEVNGEKLQPLVRNHQIAIYPAAQASGTR